MEGLPINVRVSVNNGQYEGVVRHYYMDVVGVLGDSIDICDREWDEVESIVSYESRWDVRCEDVTGGPATTPNFVWSDRGTISVATKGGFISF